MRSNKETELTALGFIRNRWVKLAMFGAMLPLGIDWGVRLAPVMTPGQAAALLLAGAACLYLLWYGLEDKG